MAGSFNKVILLGNLTRDPELRYTPQGTAVTDIRLAINDSYSKSQDKSATFVDVTLWKGTAETVCEYLRKGNPILIEGRLVTESWEDRDSGKRVAKLKVVAQSFQFVESGGRSSGSGGGGGQRPSGGNRSQGRQRDRPAGNNPPSDDFYEDDFGGGDFNPSDVGGIPF